MKPKTKTGNPLSKLYNWTLHKQESSIIIILALYIIFVELVNPAFLRGSNIFNVLRASGFTLIVVVGTALVLIVGGLDLSVGSVYALSAIMCCEAFHNWGMPIWLGIIIGLLTGLLCGAINGILIVKSGIPPMIATLGMQYMARGIVSAMTKGVPVFPLDPAFSAIEPTKLFGKIPVVVVLAIIMAIIGHFILSKTVFGRSIYAIGGNQEAARISGIRIDRTKMFAYMLSGLVSALAGILMASRLGSAEPSTGSGLEMKVICGAIIGGVSTFGGVGTILGAALGAIFMETLTNSLTLMRISVYWQNVVFGAVMVVSVLIDQYKRRLMQRQSIKSVKADGDDEIGQSENV